MRTEHVTIISGASLWLHTIGFGTRSSRPRQSLVEQTSRRHTCTPQCPIWRKTGERGGCGGPPSIPPHGASGLSQNSLPQSLIKCRLLLSNGRTGGGRQADYQAAVYSTTKAGEEGEARGRVGWVGGGETLLVCTRCMHNGLFVGGHAWVQCSSGEWHRFGGCNMVCIVHVCQ